MAMKKTEAACLSAWRATLLGRAKGRVLEIGGGTGVNLQYYPDGLERVVIAEPDPGMKKQLDQRFVELGKSEFETVMQSPKPCLLKKRPLIPLCRLWSFVRWMTQCRASKRCIGSTPRVR